MSYDIVSKRDVVLDPNGHQIFAENVYKVYSGREGPKTVLENIDLQITKGDFIALVGPSGCGKSTLLRLLLGAEEPTSGKLTLDGETMGPPDPTRGIVYQQYSLFPHLTTLENIMLGHRLSMSSYQWYWKGRRKEIKEQAIEYLATAQLEDQLDKYPEELSGGQRQRASVIQALMMSPRVLLMDEPFGALDPGSRARMQAFLRKKWEETGKTIVFVTHDLEEAVLLATRVLVLSQYYTDARGDNIQRGSRIVCDEPVSNKDKNHPGFTATIEHIRSFVLKPAHAWHLEQFSLRHKDSFHTPAEGEFKQ